MSRKAQPPIDDLNAALIALAAEWKHAAYQQQFGAIGCTMRECADQLSDVLKRASEPRQLHFLDDIQRVR